MDKTVIIAAIQAILNFCLPFIKKLIESKVVPAAKRKMYQKTDEITSKLIEDLAQNAAKIKDEKNELKKAAYIEGTTLGVETLRAMSEKFSQAADEIEKAIK